MGGLAYYISPPGSIAAAATDPLHTLFYVAFVLGACALFSITWIEVSGQSVSDVAQNLREQQYFLQVRGGVSGDNASVALYCCQVW